MKKEEKIQRFCIKSEQKWAFAEFGAKLFANVSRAIFRLRLLKRFTFHHHKTKIEKKTNFSAQKPQLNIAAVNKRF